MWQRQVIAGWRGLQTVIAEHVELTSTQKRELGYDPTKRTQGNILYPTGADKKTTVAQMREICLSAQMKLATAEASIIRQEDLILKLTDIANESRAASSHSSTPIPAERVEVQRLKEELDALTSTLNEVQEASTVKDETIARLNAELTKAKEVPAPGLATTSAATDEASDKLAEAETETEALKKENEALKRANQEVNKALSEKSQRLGRYLQKYKSLSAEHDRCDSNSSGRSGTKRSSSSKKHSSKRQRTK